jgi:hypothetical protein
MRTRDLPVTALRDSNLFSGVLALESAGYFHGLNMYGVTPVVLMSGTPFKVITSYMKHIPFICNTREDLIYLGGKLFVTSPERTVCELVIADGNDEFIYQSIGTYLSKLGDESKLMAYARKYGCEEQMRNRINGLNSVW